MTEYKNLINFIRSTYQEPEAFIPLHDPRFIGNEKKYLNECIDSNFVSSVGEFVGRFEKIFTDRLELKYTIVIVDFEKIIPKNTACSKVKYYLPLSVI